MNESLEWDAFLAGYVHTGSGLSGTNMSDRQGPPSLMKIRKVEESELGYDLELVSGGERRYTHLTVTGLWQVLLEET